VKKSHFTKRGSHPNLFLRRVGFLDESPPIKDLSRQPRGTELEASLVGFANRFSVVFTGIAGRDAGFFYAILMYIGNYDRRI
jgi:hypothetical protein